MNKIFRRTGLISALAAALAVSAGCDDSITDFGFNGQISGTVRDQSGDPVPGNVATTDLRVFVLGDGELEPLEIRVKPDGSYLNTHLYPQRYDLWIEGAVVSDLTRTNAVSVDLTRAPVVHDITVTPFLTIAMPTVSQPSGTSVDISYNATPVGADAVGDAAVWVSNASYPGPTTGSVVPDNRVHTVQTNLAGSSGTVTVADLYPGRTYYVRIGARAQGSTLWNYSDQVSVTTN